MLKRPRQNTFLEFSDLQSVFENDCIASDQIDTADMRVEIHTNARPVEARGDLLDVGRFTRAVITLDHHAAIVRKACKDRECRVRIEYIAFVKLGHMLGRGRKCRHLPVDVDTKRVAHIDGCIGLGRDIALAGEFFRGV